MNNNYTILPTRFTKDINTKIKSSPGIRFFSTYREYNYPYCVTIEKFTTKFKIFLWSVLSLLTFLISYKNYVKTGLRYISFLFPFRM